MLWRALDLSGGRGCLESLHPCIDQPLRFRPIRMVCLVEQQIHLLLGIILGDIFASRPSEFSPSLQRGPPDCGNLHANNRNKGGNKHPDATSEVRVLNAPRRVANRAEGALSQRQRDSHSTQHPICLSSIAEAIVMIHSFKFGASQGNSWLDIQSR